MEQKSKFDEFLFALIYLADERSKEKPSVEMIDSWYQRAQELFESAISEAVRQEIESIDLQIVVLQRNAGKATDTACDAGILHCSNSNSTD